MIVAFCFFFDTDSHQYFENRLAFLSIFFLPHPIERVNDHKCHVKKKTQKIHDWLKFQDLKDKHKLHM